jgi:hypothetical protein
VKSKLAFASCAILVASMGSETVFAQATATSARVTCNNIGGSAPEPVGDRDGHTLQVAEASCTVQGGPLDGAVLTQNTLWEYDKGVGNMISSHGVYRKPGAMAIYVNSAGTINLVMTEGKVTGWTASGKGRYAMASGSAVSLSGKTYSWTARPTGPRSYVVEATYD